MPASYKVPQNVDLEDKIFGPLTLKQFLMALGAGMATFFWFQFFYVPAPPVFFSLTFITWALAVVFIFVRPYDQPFTKFFFAFLWFATKPQRRIWHRMSGTMDVATEVPKPAPPKVVRPSAAEIHSRLQELAHVVDTRGWGGDVDEDLGDDFSERVTGGESQPTVNVYLSDSDQPEDILAREDEHSGSDRATSELERMLHAGVPKPQLTKHSGNAQQ